MHFDPAAGVQNIAPYMMIFNIQYFGGLQGYFAFA